MNWYYSESKLPQAKDEPKKDWQPDETDKAPTEPEMETNTSRSSQDQSHQHQVSNESNLIAQVDNNDQTTMVELLIDWN